MVNASSWEGRVSCAHNGAGAPATLPHALPGDRPVWPRDRVADMRHLKLEITLDVPAKTVRGTATHTLAPLNDGLRSITFDAMELHVTAVMAAGRPAPFENDGEHLRIDLGPGRPRGEAFDIAITYEATPRVGLYFIGPDDAYPDKPTQVWSQGQDEDNRHWFPAYDFPNDKFASEMIVTVPGHWFALSNGKLLADTPDRAGTRTFHWLQERPHSNYLVTLAAGEFSRIDASRDGLTIDYYVEPRDTEAGERTFKNTPEMVALFERVTGVAFPWDKYSQIVVRDFVFGGMENTSATTMTENILFDRKAARDFTSDPLISHELAHMWFGDLLTCRDWSHGWLNESFATYLEMLWDEQHLGIDEYRQGAIENTNLYLQERYRRPIVTNIFNAPLDIFDRHLYEKGSVVIHMLRGLLGDSLFFRSIQRYCCDNQERSVVTHDLAVAIEAETGRNLEWFFDQWVFKPGHPNFKVSWSWDQDAKLATVAVKQTHKTDDGTPVFRVPVTIDFRVARAKPSEFRVEITEPEHTFVFPLPRKPDVCRFDPHNFVLKELDFEKSVGELRLELRDGDDIAGRQAAAAGLGKKGGREAIEALETAVMGDRFWAVQAAAAKALGAVRTPAARDALMRSLAVRHPKARRAVVAALGEFHGDAGVFDALMPIAKRDQSWFIEGEANRSIGKLRLPASFDAIVANIERDSFRQVVRIGCVDGLAELREERGLNVLLAAARYGTPFQARPAAVAALARLVAYFDPRQKEVGEQFVEFLRDHDFRVRIAAANALKALGRPEFAGALEDMAKRELDGRGIRMGRENAAALRKGGQTSEEVRNLRDEFEKLRDENAKLRERLEKLEAAKSVR
ncbi:MAG: HEAT repeat domain-containing protein [Chloroflexi bacterium]|nr:HEAT repeat domain-containing protein [Chloroflexota bacterium]